MQPTGRSRGPLCSCVDLPSFLMFYLDQRTVFRPYCCVLRVDYDAENK
jgi:hypothetical protein